MAWERNLNLCNDSLHSFDIHFIFILFDLEGFLEMIEQERIWIHRMKCIFFKKEHVLKSLKF